MLSAMRAVDNVLTATGHDIWAVNVESSYHEEQTDASPSSRTRTRRPRSAMQQALSEVG